MNRRYPRCPECNDRLVIQKSWQRVYLRCRSCDVEYPLSKFADSMDEFLEHQLGNIPCNRF